MSKDAVLVGIIALTKKQSLEICKLKKEDSPAAVTVNRDENGAGYEGSLVTLFLMWVALPVIEQQWITTQAKLQNVYATSRPDCPPCP